MYAKAEEYIKEFIPEAHVNHGTMTLHGANPIVDVSFPEKGNKKLIKYLLEQKLTPIEYERLQGLPDGFTDVMLNGRKMSDTKRYSMMGNGWNEPTVEWILSGLKKR